MLRLAGLKRYLALESPARSDERDVDGAGAEEGIDLVERNGRWPLAMHDPLGHSSKHPPKGARLGQDTGAF